MMRIALRLAYMGTQCSGFQIQPDVPTVETYLFEALSALGIMDDPKRAAYARASRTDAGVHALGQVVAFNTPHPERALPKAINAYLPPFIWCWARAIVSPEFNPRYDAKERVYEYILYNEGYDIRAIRRACRMLEGEHDFANFASVEDDNGSTIRRINQIKVRLDGEFVHLTIAANSFLRTMVRRLITALKIVGEGIKDEEWIAQLLSPESYRESIEPAPPFGLVLKTIAYEGIEWENDEYAISRTNRALMENLVMFGTMARVMRIMQDME
ncbi:tRNA pseudouridine(38-40) synthase TruA [Methermicoccus shengliensis]|nr:tRNA pseudouridine(38-40) synthase TruA [Methermicoccus shengliensis]KUK30653.1 MAG: tRNA pseudouridine synthase A [Methanosarcinales archeaon 56_1174]MDN5295477.1 tRNA pseudouridine38-40 synthase [Methanosarcinales archaeon]